MGPSDLHDALSKVVIPPSDNLIVGFETGDDAAVFNYNGTMLIQTVDIIAPIVDDPYTFGRVAAINSISDIYAMGGKPLTALSVMMYPCIGADIVAAIIQGAVDECKISGCALCGGHTLTNDEIRFGLSVTGVIEGGRIYKNSEMRPDDDIILTKPIGTGIISTAIKAGLATAADTDTMISSMLLSNKAASEVMKRYDVSACTDLTGFGLIGHLYEMAKAADIKIVIKAENIPTITNVYEYAKMGLVPAGAYNNTDFVGEIFTSSVPKEVVSVAFDPQTSGGLILAVSKKDSAKLINDLKMNGCPSASLIGEAAGRGKKIELI